MWCTPPNQLHSKVGRNAVESNLAIINDVMVEGRPVFYGTYGVHVSSIKWTQMPPSVKIFVMLSQLMSYIPSIKVGWMIIVSDVL